MHTGVRKPLWRQAVHSTALLCTGSNTVRNDAGKSTVCRQSGSHIACVMHSMRTCLAFAWSCLLYTSDAADDM
eukprot:4923154-Lingulodinium_polyedra.AAC.1